MNECSFMNVNLHKLDKWELSTTTLSTVFINSLKKIYTYQHYLPSSIWWVSSSSDSELDEEDEEKDEMWEVLEADEKDFDSSKSSSYFFLSVVTKLGD